MLLRITLLRLLSASLVVAQSLPPDVLDGYDPDAVLQSMKGGLGDMDSSVNDHDIRGHLRGFLGARQIQCIPGYAVCTNQPGRLARQLPFFFSLVAVHARFGRGYLFAVSRYECV